MYDHIALRCVLIFTLFGVCETSTNVINRSESNSFKTELSHIVNSVPPTSQLQFILPGNMSEYSDDEGSRKGPSKEAISLARGIADLSDDDSDDGRSRPPQRSRSPTPDSRSPSPSRSRSRSNSPQPERDDDDHNDKHVSDDKENGDEPIASPPRELDSYDRQAGFHGQTEKTTPLMYFPPNISLSPVITTNLQEIPVEQYPILFRLKPGVRQKDETAADALLRVMKGKKDMSELHDVLESNTKLITWSDGSQTLTIGSRQFLLTRDVVASKHYIFRRGDKIQTYEAGVDRVVRLQPCSTEDTRAKLAMAAANDRARMQRKPVQKMLRCMDDDGEQMEAKAKMESHRRERERARLEAKRRQSQQRQVRPQRNLTVDALESGGESDDDQMHRMDERLNASRLLRAKRAAPAVRKPDPSVKRRKAGGRRVVRMEDYSSDESD